MRVCQYLPVFVSSHTRWIVIFIPLKYYSVTSPSWITSVLLFCTCSLCSCYCSGLLQLTLVYAEKMWYFQKATRGPFRSHTDTVGGAPTPQHTEPTMYFCLPLTPAHGEESLMSFWCFSGCLLPLLFVSCLWCMQIQHQTWTSIFFFFFLLITMEDYNGLFGRKASPTKFWVSVNVMPTPATTSTWINPIKPSLISWIAFWELITAVVEF